MRVSDDSNRMDKDKGEAVQKQRFEAVDKLSLACGLGLAAVALAHPVVANRSYVAIAAGVVLLAAGLWAAIREKSVVTLPAMAGWLSLLWLLALYASATLQSSWQWRSLLPPSLSVGLLWLGGRLGRSHNPSTLVHCIVAAALVCACHGLLQHLGADPLMRLDAFPQRVVGPFLNPNHLGSFLALALPLAMATFIPRSQAASRTLPATLITGAAIVAIYSGLLLAGSRGAIWAAAAGCIVVVIAFALALRRQQQRPRWIPYLLLLLSLGAVTRLLQERPIMEGPAGEVSVGQRLQALPNMTGKAAENDLTVVHRRVLWKAAWEIFLRNPILGVGPGNYPLVAVKTLETMSEDRRVVLLASLHRLEVSTYAHNEWLHSLAETGLVGTLPWSVLAIFWLLADLHRIGRETSETPIGCAGACGAVLVHGLVSYPLYLPATMGSFWMLLGIYIWYVRNNQCEST
jgi:O-antigen ligase